MMSESPYTVLGADVATLLGRSGLTKQLHDRLTKPTPDHVTVVGPRHYGKSVLLKHIAHVFATSQPGYVTSAYWDLRHNTPTSHAAFLSRLAVVLKAALRDAGESGLVEDLVPTDDGVFDSLECLRDELTRDAKRVLLVMDGFDHVLASDGISRRTWDVMRTLSQGKGLVMVTGSRRGLRELCRTQESAASDFWEVFNPQPLRVGRFGKEGDWEALSKPFVDRGITVDGAAVAELFNWTGGIPTLVMLVLDRLYGACGDGGTLSKSDVDQVAEAVADECRDVVAPLWEECDEDIKSAYLDLVREGQIRLNEFKSDHKAELVQRGLAREDGSCLRASARMVELYAKQQSTSLETLTRLFGEPSRFVHNAKSLLELRLKQIRTVDNALHATIRKAIRELPEAVAALSWARTITNQAFELIWRKEAPDGVVPDSWLLTERMPQPGESIPGGAAAVNLLRHVTGTDRSPRMTKHVTKRTYVLMSFVHSAGDHGQHLPPGEGSGPYVVAYCLAAIELAESLALDLGPT
jgi:hypothetical protein